MSTPDPAQTLITRRRVLAWLGAGAAATAAPLLGSCSAPSSAPPRSASGRDGSTPSNNIPLTEMRLHSIMIPVGLMRHMKGKEWTFASPLGELPLVAHTKETWKRFSGINPMAARLAEGPHERLYVADRGSLREFAQVPFRSNIITPYAVYARNKFGHDQIWGINFAAPLAAHRRVLDTALSMSDSLGTVFRRDRRLSRLGQGKNAFPASVEEALALEDMPALDTQSAMAMLFSYPPTMIWEPDGAAATSNIIQSSAGLNDLGDSIQSCYAQGLPYGNMTQMVKKVNPDGTIVPEHFDPRVGGTIYQWPADEGEPPTVPDDIGSQPATWFEPFLMDGAKYGQPGLQEDVPPELITGMRSAFRAANNEVTNTLGDTASMGTIRPENQPPETIDQLYTDLKGKNWQVTYADRPLPIIAQTGAAIQGENSACQDAVKWTITNPLPCGGIQMELKSVDRDPDTGATKISIRIYNNFERYVAFGIQYFDGRGYPMQPPFDKGMSDSITNDWTWNEFGDGMLTPVPLVFGMPIEGWSDMNYRNLEFYLPVNSDASKSKSAVRVRIITGTMGLSDDQWRTFFPYLDLDDKGNEKLGPDGKPILLQAYQDIDSNQVTQPTWYEPAVWGTLGSCIGIPGLLLLVQAVLTGVSVVQLKKARYYQQRLKQVRDLPEPGLQDDPYFEELLEQVTAARQEFMGVMEDGFRLAASTARWALGAVPLFGAMVDVALGVSNPYVKKASSNGWSMLVSGLPNLILNLIQWYVFTGYFKKYLESLAVSATTKAIPIIGQIFMAAAIGADLSQLTQAVSEVYTTSHTGAWEITGTYDVALTLTPANATFSPAAATWFVEVLYQGQKGVDDLDPGTLDKETKGYTQFPADLQHVIPSDFKLYTDGCGNLLAKHCTDFPGTDDDPFCVSPTASPSPSGTSKPADPRSTPLTIKIPGVKFGTPVQYVFHLLSEDAFEVGTWTSDSYSNNDLQKCVTVITGTVAELGIPQTADSTYERESTSALQAGKIEFVSGRSVPGTIHSAPDIIPGSIVVGRGTGLASYVMQQNGTWFVRQLMTGDDPTESELAQSWRGERPWIAVDQLAKLGQGKNWLLEPVAGEGNGQDGYHVRALDLNPRSFAYDTKLSYGRFLAPLTHLSMAPSGHLLGVHADTGKLAVLFPSLFGTPPEADKMPKALYHAGPGNASGSRPGLLSRPVGVVAAGNGVIAVLEQGPQRMQAFAVVGHPMKAFQTLGTTGPTGDPDYYADFDSGANDGNPQTFLDVTSDNGHGFIFVLSYLGAGKDLDDYIIDVFAPGSSQRLYRVKGFNSAKLASDPYRNLYASNFQTISTLTGSAAKQPSTSIWVPRTPHRVKP